MPGWYKVNFDGSFTTDNKFVTLLVEGLIPVDVTLLVEGLPVPTMIDMNP